MSCLVASFFVILVVNHHCLDSVIYLGFQNNAILTPWFLLLLARKRSLLSPTAWVPGIQLKWGRHHKCLVPSSHLPVFKTRSLFPSIVQIEPKVFSCFILFSSSLRWTYLMRFNPLPLLFLFCSNYPTCGQWELFYFTPESPWEDSLSLCTASLHPCMTRCSRLGSTFRPQIKVVRLSKRPWFGFMPNSI